MARKIVIHYDAQAFGGVMRPYCHTKYDTGKLTMKPQKVTCFRCIRKAIWELDYRRQILVEGFDKARAFEAHNIVADMEEGKL